MFVVETQLKTTPSVRLSAHRTGKWILNPTGERTQGPKGQPRSSEVILKGSSEGTKYENVLVSPAAGKRLLSIEINK